MFNTVLMVIVYLFLQMCFIWMLYRRTNNPSIVDVSWSVGLMASGLLYLFTAGLTTRKLIVASLLVIWALRLALYLYLTRIRYGHLDKRYTNLSSQWKISQSLGFFLNFQLQALLIFIISSGVFYFIGQSSNTTLSMTDFIACLVIVLAIIGETLSDIQLSIFKNQHPGKVCDVGLWYYSRHPNYFFDWLSWFGFTLMALQSTYGCFSLISIVVLYLIFTRLTGPMTERASIKSRGQAYLDYQATTSMFVPWFKA